MSGFNVLNRTSATYLTGYQPNVGFPFSPLQSASESFARPQSESHDLLETGILEGTSVLCKEISVSGVVQTHRLDFSHRAVAELVRHPLLLLVVEHPRCRQDVYFCFDVFAAGGSHRRRSPRESDVVELDQFLVRVNVEVTVHQADTKNRGQTVLAEQRTADVIDELWSTPGLEFIVGWH